MEEKEIEEKKEIMPVTLELNFETYELIKVICKRSGLDLNSWINIAIESKVNPIKKWYKYSDLKQMPPLNTHSYIFGF